MEERCLKCHNDPKLYELDEFRKTDWKAGDIRGVLEVVCPLEDNTEQTQKTLLNTYLQVAGTGAAVLTLSWAGLMFGQAETSRLTESDPIPYWSGFSGTLQSMISFRFLGTLVDDGAFTIREWM